MEGFHALKHALRFGAQIAVAVTADPSGTRALAADLAPDIAPALDALLRPVTRDELRALSPRAHHTEVLALARRPEVDVASALAAAAERPAVLLEDPRHLGNVGAVVRVAAAADAAAVVTTGATDPWDPQALRGSAGLHFALPVARIGGAEAGEERGRVCDAAGEGAAAVARAAGRPLVALDPDGDDLLTPGAVPPGALLAFGTERHGLSDALLEAADARVRIPMRAGVSSLNLATAVAAALYGAR